MVSRSCGSCCISWTKPWPSCGAEQVRGRHAHVVEEELGRVLRLHADLVEIAPALKAAASSVSTTISEVPLAPRAGSVLATTMTRSASWPLLMKVFCPLMT